MMITSGKERTDSMEIALWFAAMVIFGIVEAATVALVSVWFMGGALGAMITALAGGEVWLQVTVFLVVSGLLLACLRPLVQRYVKPKTVATNADALVGKLAVVTESIDNLDGQGAVKINGVIWTARSENDRDIPQGATVRITKIEGAKLFVTPAEVAAGQRN